MTLEARLQICYVLHFLLAMAFLLHPGQGQHQLSVTNGYGGGTYNAGEKVHVFAEYTQENELVSGWDSNVDIGNTDGKLGLKGEWHFSFNMPASDVTLRPRLDQFPLEPKQLIDLTLSSSTGTELPVWYYIPKNPVGVVGFFHGSGGSRKFLTNPQPWYTARQLVHAGYGIFATSSQESINKVGKKRWNTKWNSFCSNNDLKNIKIVLEKFSSRGLITNETNLHAIGMSNGGVFAYTLVQAGGLGFSSGLSTCAHGDLNIDPSLPFMWQMCENDSQESVARKKGNSVANYEKLLKKDIPSIHVTHPASPVYPERFTRIRGVSATTSRNLYMYMQDNGLLSEKKYIIRPETDEDLETLIGKSSDFNSLDGRQKLEFRGELFIALAEHRYFDDYSKEVIDFFKSNSNAIPTFANRSIKCFSLTSLNIIWILVVLISSILIFIGGFVYYWRHHRRQPPSQYAVSDDVVGQEIPPYIPPSSVAVAVGNSQ